ncbi:MAG: hypothetical protein AAF699_18015 [Pseudomonadota bacterium]
MKVRNAIEGIVEAVPCFVMAGTLMATWWNPMLIEEGKWVRLGVGIMVLEFILVHSGVVMASIAQTGSRWENIKLTLLAVAFYSLFGITFAYAFQSWTLFWIYSFVMFSRWIPIVTRPLEAKTESQQRSVIAVMFYMLAVILSLFVPWPELGLSDATLKEIYPDRGTGEWERHPESALAAGVIYFSCIGLRELLHGFSSGTVQHN